MKSNHLKLGAMLSLLVACTEPNSNAVISDTEAADLVIVGDNIVTVDPDNATVKAVAVRGDRIVAVGSTADVMALAGETTRVIELGEKALVPGFIDAHGHFLGSAMLSRYANLSSPPVGPVEDIDDLVNVLSQHIQTSDAEPGSWVFGYGYDDSLIAEGRHPTRHDLDRVSTDHKIVVTHVSGHLLAANSAALSAKGVDDSTPDPDGGVIRREDGSLQPDGVMEETAMQPFSGERMAGMTPELAETLIRDMLRTYAGYGITTVQDGGSSAESIALYRHAASLAPLSLDVVAFRAGNALEPEQLAALETSKEYNAGFRLGGVKLFLDGSPQGRTAYLSEPYSEGPPGADADYRAYPTHPAEKYFSQIAALLEAGVPTMAHANGDAAIEMMIDGVDAVLADSDISDHRAVIIHAQLTREDQLQRIRSLGLVPSYYAAHPFFWGDWHRRSFGEDRAAFISPAGRSVELGIPFTIHNDSPVVPPDVMRLMWIAVNRKTRSGFVLGEDQRLTPLQALHATTLGAAYQYFEEDEKGSITPGKRADLVILGANPLSVDPDTIKDIPIIETFARGESVYLNVGH